MVTNSFQERELPIWEFFVSLPIPARGLPLWLWGLVFLPSPESQVHRRATKILAKKPKFPAHNGNSQIPISERGLPISIRGLKWH
jgi:hypothetical protein